MTNTQAMQHDPLTLAVCSALIAGVSAYLPEPDPVDVQPVAAEVNA